MTKLGFFHKRYKKDTLDKEEIRIQEMETQETKTQKIETQEIEIQVIETQKIETKKIGIQEIEIQKNNCIEQEKIYLNRIEELKEYGIDIERGVKRFSGKRALYLKYLKEFTKDESMQEVKFCMETENYELAQKKVHAIKGIVGNLSIDILYDSSCQLMETLREEKFEKAKELFQEMSQIYIQVCDLISRIEEE